MAAAAPPFSSSSRQFLSNPTSLSPRPPLFLRSPTRTNPAHLSYITRAASGSDTEPESDPQPPSPDDFDSRLSQIRLRNRSGTGKKAEIRKAKKGKNRTESDSTGTGVFLPPVPLKEPISGGLKVDFGFNPYTERVNGRLAGLGLVALLLVELATGKSVISYHTPAIVFIQVYFMAAVSALYLKFEKEKISVWPQTDVKQ